ncbi:hypothetical protein F2841_13020 [Bacteroides fragilis]|nr:hypothetical protein F2841_13020 [Bacteroides fragilis]KAA4776904.1 hypothetical protein F3B22_15810 [Bacteroides fragilis]KAA4794124.1 hypothetical protein F3B21_06085 [Bacteroides fragilis]KAA4795362.1 hypothetical protein F2047_05375 [Bacteroides fragilis]
MLRRALLRPKQTLAFARTDTGILQKRGSLPEWLPLFCGNVFRTLIISKSALDKICHFIHTLENYSYLCLTN